MTEQQEQRQPDKGGRPPFYTDPNELEAKAKEYFESLLVRDAEGKIDHLASKSPTITGLVLYLGFCDRSSFYKYADKPEFRHTIKKLRTMIENAYENCLHGANVAGIIFALKNLGWSDKQEIESTQRIVEMPTIKVKGKDLHFDIGSDRDSEPAGPARQADADSDGVQ